MPSSAHDSTLTRDVLGVSRLHVNVNGTDFTLPDNDSLFILLSLLQEHPLDPMFEDYGNFMVPCRASCKGEFDGDTCEYTYLDLGPVYEDAPNAVRFHGNFLDVWHPFSLDTDDPQLIAVLLDTIRKNQLRSDYLDARSELKRPPSSTSQ